MSTTAHSRQAKLRVHGWDPLSIANIHFHEFSTPAIPSPPPKPNNSGKLPPHLEPLFDGLLLLREPVAQLLFALSYTTQRIVVIHDLAMASVVQDVVLIPYAESYSFQPVSAFFISSYKGENMREKFGIEDDIVKDLPPFESILSSEVMEFSKKLQVHHKFNSGNLYNSSNVIEAQFLDILKKVHVSSDTDIKQWAIGPFNPVVIYDSDPNQAHKCLKWLDKQAPNSVMFLSFGTTTTLSDEQILELAIGLENSEQKFIWVLRDADRVDIFAGDVRRAELPKGYEERLEGKGMVVRDWAPQLEILAHPSTGGFMSHCGWNSCLESITMGVPIAAWPMHSDQPANAVLITKVLKIGVVVKDWALGDHELVKSSTVENAVRRLMASIEGDEIRRRAAQMGAAVRSSVAEGGVARVEMDDFIAHIRR